MRNYFLKRPFNSHLENDESLLRRIERKDAMFRITQTIFFVAVLVILFILLMLSYNLQTANHNLLTNQSKLIKQEDAITHDLQSSVSALKTNDDVKLTDLQQHIDCIVSLFGQPDRANLTITDLQNCQITNTGSSTSNTSASGGSTGDNKSN